MLQTAVLTDNMNRNLQVLQEKVEGYHRDSEQYKGKVNVFVSQKMDFSEERDDLSRKVLNLEREKEKLSSYCFVTLKYDFSDKSLS